ncbi:dethiobiotin synthetase [Povalibacter uvarum]|uniref:Dethiobiotin synthetase n=1 Tax=Povalibacter uvarum TaxID=732238 RepID=A0A841HLM5_9GAMM|nr:dethiobiotin synthase [Povalibacter uvarum]MBB6093494.1 dethiobiotin synthetase [Povalibacter uvarum]
MSHPRPARLVGVIGTHTDIGKTWATSRLIERLRAKGLRVSARKPVQSFEAHATVTDADVLAAASGEDRCVVCPSHRWYPRALAPPMAADCLSQDPIKVNDLVAEIAWPAECDIGFVETVGGLRSPIAHDGDSLDLLVRVNVDEFLLIADAALGTINAIQLTLGALPVLPTTILLNRFDETNELHRLNRDWLAAHCDAGVLTDTAGWR